MAIEYVWMIDEMFAYPKVGRRKNVVFGVTYTLSGADGDIVASVSGSTPIAAADDKFTLYTSLTEAEVVGWAQDALGVAKIAEFEALIAQFIKDQIAPSVASPPIPWQKRN